MCSWSNFDRLATPGKIHHQVFSICLIMALTVFDWNAKALEMALYPFSDR